MSDFYIICYDVGDDRRRRRVVDELENHGQRVQRSVFECHLEQSELNALLASLLELIDEDDDRLRCYSLCPKDRPKIVVDGNGRVSEDADYHIV